MPAPSIIDTRREQMFPVLAPAEIARLRRFGEPRSYPAGAALAKVGEAGHGLTIILAGKVDITQHHGSGPGLPITTHEAGGSAAVGEGAQVVATLHAFLAERRAAKAPQPAGQTAATE